MDIAVYEAAMGNHMSYGITQCYLPPGSGDFPAFTSLLELATPDGCKAELTWVVVSIPR